jgi:hypothetical protein
MTPDPSPWMSRSQAASYLGVSTDSIDRRLVPLKGGPVECKLRFVVMQWDTQHAPIRILREDVEQILPRP